MSVDDNRRLGWTVTGGEIYRKATPPKSEPIRQRAYGEGIDGISIPTESTYIMPKKDTINNVLDKHQNHQNNPLITQLENKILVLQEENIKLHNALNKIEEIISL